MTDTIEKPAAAAITPQARVDAWLANFEAALAVLGGLVQGLLIASWPRRRWRVQRSALSRARSTMVSGRAARTFPGGLRDTTA